MKGRKDDGCIDVMEYIGDMGKMEEFIGMLDLRKREMGNKSRGSEVGDLERGSFKLPVVGGGDVIGDLGGKERLIGKRRSMPNSVG